jgi:hypothetical protein
MRGDLARVRHRRETANHPHPRRIDPGQRLRRAPCAQNQEAACFRPNLRFIEQAAFAAAGFSRNQYNPALPASSLAQASSQHLKFVVSTEQNPAHDSIPPLARPFLRALRSTMQSSRAVGLFDRVQLRASTRHFLANRHRAEVQL